MGKKNKNKKKRVNPKRERYSKFRKEKPTNLTFTIPEDSPEYQKQKQEDERTIGFFMRGHIRNPRREIVERKLKSKR